MAVRDLIANLGHYCDRKGLNFIEEVRCGLGMWADEQRWPEDLGPAGQEAQAAIWFVTGGPDAGRN
jgi:hypothetical protein